MSVSELALPSTKLAIVNEKNAVTDSPIRSVAITAILSTPTEASGGVPEKV